MDLFAFRRPCPVKYEVHLTGVNGKQKKDNPLRSLRLVYLSQELFFLFFINSREAGEKIFLK